MEGRQLSESDLALVKRVAEDRAEDGLEAISEELCRLWCWSVLGGGYATRQCQAVLVELHRQQAIEIPGLSRQGQPPSLEEETVVVGVDTSPLESSLSANGSVRICVVSGAEEGDLWDGLIGKYHYLGQRRVIGNHLKYLAYLGARPVGATLWGAAALRLAARDRLLGWSGGGRKPGLERLACNYRFLIFPWVMVPHLASHLLGATTRRISRDWQEHFGHGLDLLETFVDPRRFAGTCYRAANWVCVGRSHGSGRHGASYHHHGQRKLIFVYPLTRKLRRTLARAPPFESELALSETPSPRARGSSQEQRTHLLSLGRKERMKYEPPPSACPPGTELGEPDLEQISGRFETFMGRFRDVFPQVALWVHARVYVSSLSQEIRRKSAEPMALWGGGGVPVRTLQHFLTGSVWSSRAAIVRYQSLVAEGLGEPEGILIVDESGVAKKGKESVGVARQYCGSVGKVENSQIGVHLAYASCKGTALIDGRLYLPESWFSDEQRAARWKKCRVPEDLEFKTKPEIAAEMVQDVTDLGQLPAEWVLADEVYGQNTDFLDALPERLKYFCEVPTTTRAWSIRPRTEEYRLSRGPNRGALRRRLVDAEPEAQAVSVLATDPGLEWTRVTIKEGAQGPILAEVARLRVVEARHSLPGREAWLFLRRSMASGEIKYFLCNALEDTPIQKMAWLSGMRWPIETCFREAKDELGMDHYEVRSWTGWHRHMALVMLAHFLMLLIRNLLQKKLCSDDSASPEGPSNDRLPPRGGSGRASRDSGMDTDAQLSSVPLAQ
ncbi:MAG: IS701 family transposase [bacterium]|nr:IS701 family transposase [bacterium]